MGRDFPTFLHLDDNRGDEHEIHQGARESGSQEEASKAGRCEGMTANISEQWNSVDNLILTLSVFHDVKQNEGRKGETERNTKKLNG